MLISFESERLNKKWNLNRRSQKTKLKSSACRRFRIRKFNLLNYFFKGVIEVTFGLNLKSIQIHREITFGMEHHRGASRSTLALGLHENKSSRVKRSQL